jgi:capsular polysaccharide transport system permease protein
MDMEVSPIFAKPSPPVDGSEASEVVTRKRWRPAMPGRLFWVVVVAPVMASVAYYGFLASDVYISESSFTIHSPDKQASANGIAGMLQSVGFSSSGSESGPAEEYASSRDALRAINKGNAFEKAYLRPDIFKFDRFNPLGLWGSFEHLYDYSQDKITLGTDAGTQVTTLTVRAFSPKDAHRFNNELLGLTEQLVNHLNDRGRKDTVRYAQSDVDIAKARSQSAALALAAYRSRSGIVDPQAESQTALAMISNLQTQLIASRTELAGIVRFAPQNPRIPVLRTQIANLQSEIKQETRKLTSGRQSLSGSSVEYQRLALESEFADKQLAAALGVLDQARDEARRQAVYLERVVQPNVPDAPMEPRRIRDIFATFVLSLIAFGILKMLLAGVKEHAQ